MSKQNDIVLETKKLSKHFSGLAALDSFDLQVHKGDIHCLIGPNGAGKSTVFKIITGVYPPTSGKVFYNGKDITGIPAYKIAKQGMAIKMQVPGVFENLTLRDNMRIAAQNFVPANEVEDKIDSLIERVKLENIGNPQVKSMSHGQQQWLEIAMCLSSNPGILLLDEPAAGLGTEETEYTAQLVQELNDHGMTILFIEHDMNFVKRIAKTVTVLYRGQKFAEGNLDDILNNEGVKDIYLGKEAT